MGGNDKKRDTSCRCGNVWETMGCFGKPWNVLGNGGGVFWHVLGKNGVFWARAGCFGIERDVLGNIGIC